MEDRRTRTLIPISLLSFILLFSVGSMIFVITTYQSNFRAMIRQNIPAILNIAM